MKSADDYYDELDSVDEFGLMRLIKEVQKEAWNESILLSAESATVSYSSDIAGRHYHVNKDSILKNLIP
ncbi:MAG: hypothetical protein ACYC5G_05230 [Candidatus Doudnabacteria bacterium]